MSNHDYDNDQPFGSPDAPPEKKPRGCFFYGCLISSIAVGLLVLLMVGGGIATYFYVKKQVVAYTDEEPAELPVVEATEEELAEIKARVEGMEKAAKEGAKPADLVLTAGEINALITENADFKGKVYVTIEDGQLTGDVSIPLEELPVPGGKGRYFNASATLEVDFEDGVLVVKLVDATVKGEPLPGQFIDAMKDQNLAQDLYKDEKNVKFLRQFEQIELRDDKLILRVRQDDEEGEPGGGEEATADSSDEADSAAEAAPVGSQSAPE